MKSYSQLLFLVLLIFIDNSISNFTNVTLQQNSNMKNIN